jgi:hypothetical protein
MVRCQMMALLPFRLMQQHTLQGYQPHTNLLLWRNPVIWCTPAAARRLLLQDHTRLLLLQNYTAAALQLWPSPVLLLLLGLAQYLLLPACPVR